jgi:hypothetical protein
VRGGVWGGGVSVCDAGADGGGVVGGRGGRGPHVGRCSLQCSRCSMSTVAMRLSVGHYLSGKSLLGATASCCPLVCASNGLLNPTAPPPPPHTQGHLLQVGESWWAFISTRQRKIAQHGRPAPRPQLNPRPPSLCCLPDADPPPLALFSA